MQTRQSGRAVDTGRFFTLAVTNCIKIGGLYLAVRAGVTEPNPSPLQIVEACFMMAGAQVTEDAILNLVGRMFGSHEGHREGDAK